MGQLAGLLGDFLGAADSGLRLRQGADGEMRLGQRHVVVDRVVEAAEAVGALALGLHQQDERVARSPALGVGGAQPGGGDRQDDVGLLGDAVRRFECRDRALVMADARLIEAFADVRVDR